MGGSENETSPVSKTQSDDELSLLDLVKFIQRHGVTLLGGALIGGTLGLAVASTLLAQQWEASVLIRVGQIGNASTPIESPAWAMSRLKESEPFENNVLKNLGLSPNTSGSKAGLLRNALNVKIEKPDLLYLSIRGTSREMAEQLASATVEELKDVHAKMAEPTIARWRKELDDVTLELERASREFERLSRLLDMQSNSITDRNLYQAVLASNILFARETELHGFRERKHTLQEQLSPERTFSTSSWGRTEVSEQPVSPKKSRFAAGGLIIGLLMGVLLALWRSRGSVDKKS
jgi:uncharacterized protein involved in exopolysaccharide biosynthesis